MTALPYAEGNMMICEAFSIHVQEHDEWMSTDRWTESQAAR